MQYSDLFCEKYRPQTFDDVVMDDNVRILIKSIFDKEDPVIPNLLLWGHPGGGKTTIAKIIQKTLGWETLKINASEENGIDDMRNKVVGFTDTVSINGKMKLVILEEADGLSKSGGMGSSAQELLKNLIESTSSRVRFIMLVNNISKIDPAITSRMQEIHVMPPKLSKDNQALLRLIGRVVTAEKISVPNKQDLVTLINKCYPDVRKMLQVLQQFSSNEKHEFVFSQEVENRAESIAKNVLNMVFTECKGKRMTDFKLMEIRKYIIENEGIFDVDYHVLLKAMFEAVANCESKGPAMDKIKRGIMISLADHMQKHTSCIDKEINAFCAVIEIAEVIESVTGAP